MHNKNSEIDKKEFDKILYSFTKKISNLNNFKSHIDDSTERAYEHYEELNESMKEHIKEKELIISGNSVLYWNIESGTHESLDPNINTFSDIMSTITVYQNKQYQWLLVDAYEAFEDFLDELYAYTGFIDNNFWIAKDFGSLSINEIDKQNKEWFNIRVKEIRGRPNVIYKQIKKKIPLLNYHEKRNQLNINLQFEINLISQLRHRIVHNGGVINNKDSFNDSVLNKIGLGPDNPNRKKYEGEINNYIGTRKIYNRLEIILYKHRIKDDQSGLPTHIDRLDTHISTLTSYATLLTSLTKKYLNEKLEKCNLRRDN